jgi:hypothetical protein
MAPRYLCSALLDAVPGPRRFCPISETLQVDDDTWLREVGPGDLLVFIDYFGFRSWEEHAAVASDRGAWIVEDACQALANASYSAHAHYVIASPRKFVGLPDGGLLLAQPGCGLPDAVLPAPSAAWWPGPRRSGPNSTGRAAAARGSSCFNAPKPHLRRTGPYEHLSAHLLRHAVDWPGLARRRRTNYVFLTAALRPIALLPDLPAGVVPLGFPVVVRRAGIV